MCGVSRIGPLMAGARSHPGGLTRDHVVWAYRLLLDRDPENEDVDRPEARRLARHARSCAAI